MEIFSVPNNRHQSIVFKRLHVSCKNYFLFPKKKENQILFDRNFLHTIADCENDEAEADEGHYGLWLLTVSSMLKSIYLFANLIYQYRSRRTFDAFKSISRLFTSIQTNHGFNWNSSKRRCKSFFFYLVIWKLHLFQAALRMEAQKMTNEINFYQEEIASNKEQIELVRNRIIQKIFSLPFFGVFSIKQRLKNKQESKSIQQNKSKNWMLIFLERKIIMQH